MRDRDWLIPVALIWVVQLLLWWTVFLAGYAYPPMLLPYGRLAYLFLSVAGTGRMLWLVVEMARNGEPRPFQRLVEIIRANLPRIMAVIVGVQFFAIGTSAFGAIKAALPETVPFWLDPFLARVEAAIFGAHPWQITHALFGWATAYIDGVYASFVPVQMLTLYCLLMAKPSPQKAQALVTLALAWLVLGIAAAYLLSSAGPIYYDRVYSGDTFSGLTAALNQSAPLTIKTEQALWRAHTNDAIMIANGISAMPSMHVALSFWLVLLIRKSRFAPIAWAYFALIWLGSVHLGWHYLSCGLVGAAGVLALWNAAPTVIAYLSLPGEPGQRSSVGHDDQGVTSRPKKIA